MFGLSRQVQQALIFLFLVLVFGGGVLYGRWQETAGQEDIFLLEKEEEAILVEAQEEPEELKVHVAGAVKYPGVYSFNDRNRVEDVVILAEPLPEADLDVLNLAAYLRDEQRIYVPYRQAAGNSNQSGANAGVSGSDSGGLGQVNLNTAGKEELMTLPGIGPTLAQRIIDYRNSNGFFASVEELKQVSGIGDKKYQELKDLVTY